MGKVTKIAKGKNGRRGPAKGVAHGTEKAKRKPTSPIVLRKQREKDAAQFGKSAAFRKDIYGIEETTT